jgi:hypothetical protein
MRVANAGQAWHRHRMRLLRTIGLMFVFGSVARASADDGASKRTLGSAAPSDVSTLTSISPVLRLAPTVGFVDDPVWTDGKTFAYVVADAGAMADLHIVDVATKTDRVVALPAELRQSRAIRIVGDTVVVIATTDGGQQFAQWLFAGRKPTVRSATATEVSFQQRDGRTVVVAYSRTERPAPVRGAASRASAPPGSTAPPVLAQHSIEVYDVVTGKRVAKSKPLTTDAQGLVVDRLYGATFHINHWDRGHLVALGIVDGVFNKKTDQRGPNQEAILDPIAGKIVTPTAITDLVEQRKRFEALRDKTDMTFAAVAKDRSAVELWQQGKKTNVTGISMSLYKLDSLAVSIASDVTWIGLSVDPANNAAIASKRLDTAMFDVFRVVNGVATRVLRVPAENREFSIGAISSKQIWLRERNRGFSRGSKVLEVLTIE